MVNTCFFPFVFRRAPTSPTLCPETRGCETGPRNCQNTTNTSCVCFDPSFNKQLATKPPWPSIQDGFQLSSESLQTIPFEGFMQHAFLFRPPRAGITLSPSPQQILRVKLSTPKPTNQPATSRWRYPRERPWNWA